MSSVTRYLPHYTVADYLQWEGDWELWFGTAVAMSPSPFGPHERAVIEFVDQIRGSIKRHPCDCRVYAGLDWIVHEDTVVRPDVMLVCGDQPDRHLERPPNLIVEVVSSSTELKDRKEKRSLYEEQGVEVYLIADSASKSISWFALNEGPTYIELTSQFSANGEFRVCLKNGCDILFNRIEVFS